jgi:hypothetical protein
MDGSAKKPAHRPPLPPEERTEVVTMRLTLAHRQELKARGGVAAVRAWLDRKPRQAAKSRAQGSASSDPIAASPSKPGGRG